MRSFKVTDCFDRGPEVYPLRIKGDIIFTACILPVSLKKSGVIAKRRKKHLTCPCLTPTIRPQS